MIKVKQIIEFVNCLPNVTTNKEEMGYGAPHMRLIQATQICFLANNLASDHLVRMVRHVFKAFDVGLSMSRICI